MRRQRLRVLLGECPEHVVDDRAALGGARRHGDGIERVELEDVAREDRVGVAHQGLDLGDAERRAGTAPDRASARGRGKGGAGSGVSRVRARRR